MFGRADEGMVDVHWGVCSQAVGLWVSEWVRRRGRGEWGEAKGGGARGDGPGDQQSPGVRPAEVARQLGVARSTVLRRLPAMEDAGYLYREDERGGLWPFRRMSE